MRSSSPPCTEPELSKIAKIDLGLISFEVVTEALVVNVTLPLAVPVLPSTSGVVVVTNSFSPSTPLCTTFLTPASRSLFSRMIVLKGIFSVRFVTFASATLVPIAMISFTGSLITFSLVVGLPGVVIVTSLVNFSAISLARAV